MGDCTKHDGHAHSHGPGCGHKQIQHGDHKDFLHDGHLHHVHGDHVDEHSLAASKDNPADCTPDHACEGHAADHTHGPSCGHDAVAHGDHVDYVVDGHLHHAHGAHCDDHGRVHVS